MDGPLKSADPTRAIVADSERGNFTYREAFLPPCLPSQFLRQQRINDTIASYLLIHWRTRHNYIQVEQRAAAKKSRTLRPSTLGRSSIGKACSRSTYHQNFTRSHLGSPQWSAYVKAMRWPRAGPLRSPEQLLKTALTAAGTRSLKELGRSGGQM